MACGWRAGGVVWRGVRPDAQARRRAGAGWRVAGGV